MRPCRSRGTLGGMSEHQQEPQVAGQGQRPLAPEEQDRAEAQMEEAVARQADRTTGRRSVAEQADTK